MPDSFEAAACLHFSSEQANWPKLSSQVWILWAREVKGSEVPGVRQLGSSLQTANP